MLPYPIVENSCINFDSPKLTIVFPQYLEELVPFSSEIPKSGGAQVPYTK